MTFGLPWVWFALVGILFTGYAILDGFDLASERCIFSRKPTRNGASC